MKPVTDLMKLVYPQGNYDLDLANLKRVGLLIKDEDGNEILAKLISAFWNLHSQSQRSALMDTQTLTWISLWLWPLVTS
ncbi:MAG: hypothetical protein DRH15_14950, partial [Deltaproteobacteria bacterium]